MKLSKLILVLFLFVAATYASADTIKINLGGAGRVSFHSNGNSQRLTFSGLTITTADSANGTGVTLTPSGAGFMFTSVSPTGQGLFTADPGATFSMGSTASGIARGSISSIVITGASRGATNTTFTMLLTFSNMTFTNCSTLNCTNSATLRNYALEPTGTMTVTFSMTNGTASTIAQLLAMGGNHNNVPLAGELDATVTPEPASLALFGTGLLVFGLRLAGHRKKE